MENTVDRMAPELKESVRKWLNRFHFDDHSRFWDAVDLYYRKNNALPRVNDIIWGLLNESRTLEFKNANLGLYSSTTAAMCELLATEGRWSDCFFHAALKSFFDLNGPMNFGSWEYFKWQPDYALLGSLIMNHLIAPANELGWDHERARGKYLESLDKHESMIDSLEPPISPEETWNKIIESHGECFGDPQCKVATYRVKQPVLKLDGKGC